MRERRVGLTLSEVAEGAKAVEGFEVAMRLRLRVGIEPDESVCETSKVVVGVAVDAPALAWNTFAKLTSGKNAAEVGTCCAG
jgi:hypothetical protein